MRNWSWLLISLAAAAHAEPPRQVEIVFAMSRNGSPISEVVERLEYVQGNYKLSQGSLAEGSLRPREFFDERSGRDTARAWFDWNAKTLTMQYKSSKASEPLPPNAQDRLSFLFALSLVPGKADTVSYTMADGKGLSSHVYKVVGREHIRTPVGEFDTVKVARQGNDNREKAELWLAAERAYIPVRLLVVEKDGTRYEQPATRISQ